MRILGNIIWWIFGGLEAAIGYFTGSLALAITIIGTSSRTDIQARTVVSLAFWGRSEKRRKSFGLYHHPSQHHLDYLWWLMGMSYPHLLWTTSCHHNYRYSFCKTTLQNGRTVTCAIRQGC